MGGVINSYYTQTCAKFSRFKVGGGILYFTCHKSTELNANILYYKKNTSKYSIRWIHTAHLIEYR